MGNKEKCLIVAGGVLNNAKKILEKIQNLEFNLVVACDSGYDNALKLGINPDFLVGDLDSIKSEISENCQVLKLNVEKDETDLKVAVDIAIEKGFESICIICATGGRLDHFMCNLSILEYIEHQGFYAYILDEYNEISINNNRKITYINTSKYVSIIPITKSIKVSLSNLKYPLFEKTVFRDNIISVSNETHKPTYTIDILEGKAYVIKSDNA